MKGKTILAAAVLCCAAVAMVALIVQLGGLVLPLLHELGLV